LGCATPPTDAARVAPEAGPAGERVRLVDGWTWYTDPAGFRIAAPVGWLRFTDGRLTCFREPDGVRTLSVDPSVAPPADPVGYWRAEEQRLVVNGALPGYQQIGIGPSDLHPGGAEWQFRWSGPAGQPLRAWRLLLVTSATHGYVLSWSTRESDWQSDQLYRGLVQGTLRPA
ncbi:MAG TPA: serine/threonine protein kinase, partial [Micromonospora sp.]